MAYFGCVDVDDGQESIEGANTVAHKGVTIVADLVGTQESEFTWEIGGEDWCGEGEDA
jgi:hypothetical protein